MDLRCNSVTPVTFIFTSVNKFLQIQLSYDIHEQFNAVIYVYRSEVVGVIYAQTHNEISGALSNNSLIWWRP